MTSNKTSDSHPPQSRPSATASARALREAIAPYLAIPRLRRLSAQSADLRQALTCPNPPPEVLALLGLLEALLTPIAARRSRAPPTSLRC